MAALDAAACGEEAADDAGDVATDVERLGIIDTDAFHPETEAADARKDDGLAVGQSFLENVL